jgi:glycosyltransferase involved in cell wall biosynthesis
VRLLVDTVAVRPGSAAIIVSNLLKGWAAAAPEDELIVLVADEARLSLPDSARVESIGTGSSSLPARVWMQSVGVRGASRRFQADALLGGVTSSALLGAVCPYGVIVYDLRHEARPEQFSVGRRLARRLLYGWSFRRADVLICISERTRRDLLTGRPHLHDKAHVALPGADHTLGWRGRVDGRPGYVLAFGHFPNKNVDGVLRAWRLYAHQHPEPVLRICGLSKDGRGSAEQLASRLGISQRVELLPWLSDDDFSALFAGAAAILFPSDFEGFGLPAIEALRLGLPLVVSSDPALLEVTAGHAVVTADGSPASLAAAIERALAIGPDELEAGIRYAKKFTWERMAQQARAALVERLSPRSRSPRDSVRAGAAPTEESGA